MTPYEKIQNVTTTGANQVVAIPFPGRCTLTRIAIVRGGGGSIAADVYNRTFTSSAIGLKRIGDNGDTFTRLVLLNPLALAVGDSVTVASNSVSGYNTTHVITAKIDDFNYVTDQTYTAEGKNGTATLSVPVGEQILYRVVPQLTGTDSMEEFPEAVYMNQDPLLNLNIGVNRVIYFKFASAATYRIAIRAYENVAF